MKRGRRLITSPLEWQMAAIPVAPPTIPVLAERGGTQLKTPRPVLLIDTREQNPFDFSRFQAWFGGMEKKALQLGDYSVAGMEDICAVERKGLSDLVHSLTAERSVFVHRLQLMARIPPSSAGDRRCFEPSSSATPMPGPTPTALCNL